MIPENINRNHILRAAERVDRQGIPRGREARRYLVQINEGYYPIMLIISWANEVANGNELNGSRFTPQEAIRFLIRRGFNIISIKNESEALNL